MRPALRKNRAPATPARRRHDTGKRPTPSRTFRRCVEAWQLRSTRLPSLTTRQDRPRHINRPCEVPDASHDLPGPYRVRIVDKAIPQIEHPRDAIVRVTRACICGSDLHLYHGLMPDTRVGQTFGHEFVGVVEEIGIDVHSLKPGDRVLMPLNILGECYYCTKGLFSNCHNVNPNATAVGGIYGYSHTTAVTTAGRRSTCACPADAGPTRIPDTIDDDNAALCTDASTDRLEREGSRLRLRVQRRPPRALDDVDVRRPGQRRGRRADRPCASACAEYSERNGSQVGMEVQPRGRREEGCDRGRVRCCIPCVLARAEVEQDPELTSGVALGGVATPLEPARRPGAPGTCLLRSACRNVAPAVAPSRRDRCEAHPLHSRWHCPHESKETCPVKTTLIPDPCSSAKAG
jgi:hypothetical protein